MYLLSLDCGHEAITSAKLVLSSDADYHSIPCELCPNHDHWRRVTGIKETNDAVFYVQSGIPLVLPNRIMYSQHNRATAKRKFAIFPYRS